VLESKNSSPEDCVLRNFVPITITGETNSIVPQSAAYNWKIARSIIFSDKRRNVLQYFAPAMTDAMKNMLLKTLRVLIDALESANLSYHMVAGTLLGSYMHHGMIPWDDDADLFVAYRDRDKLHEVLRIIQNQNYPDHIRYAFAIPRDKYRWKVFSLNGTLRVARSFKNDYYWNVPFVDICFYDEDDDTIWDKSMDQPNVENPKRYNKTVVFPLGRRPFEGMTLRAPRNTAAFLAQNYNMDTCFSNRYSHLRERVNRKLMKVPCSRLWHIYPFVVRSRTRDGRRTLESLTINNITINRAIVDEWGSLLMS
jgi:phosphorylcholine metabolism protein LicD